MPHTVHCTCGQAIKVPDHLTHRKARCNKCGAVVRLDGAASPGSVETSDLEALPPAAESQGPGEPKACGDCGKRFPYDQLRNINGDLLCTRCRIKRDDARRRRVGLVVKSIAAVILLAGGAVAWVQWIEPAIVRYRQSQIAQDTDKDTGKKVDDTKRPTPAPPPGKDAPNTTVTPPATAPPPPNPLAPTGELATYSGAHLIAVAPAGNTIALFKRDSKRPPRHTLRLFDLAGGGELKALEMDYVIDHMAISDDGARLMSIGRVGANAELRLWDLAAMKVIASSPVLESFGRVGIAPDGGEGWCLCPQEGIRTVDAKSAAVSLFREPHVGSAYAQFDGRQKLAAIKCNFGSGGGVQQWIDIYDLGKQLLRHKIEPGERFGCFAISPDGSHMALGFADRIDIYHLKDAGWRKASQIKRINMKNAPQRAMISNDNAFLVELPFGTDGATPIVREIAGTGDGRPLDAANCIDWAPGAENDLYVLSEGEPVKRFDLATGKTK